MTQPDPIPRLSTRPPEYTAHGAVNAIPCVGAAPHGIRSTVDIPQIIADLSKR